MCICYGNAWMNVQVSNNDTRFSVFIIIRYKICVKPSILHISYEAHMISVFLRYLCLGFEMNYELENDYILFWIHNPYSDCNQLELWVIYDMIYGFDLSHGLIFCLQTCKMHSTRILWGILLIKRMHSNRNHDIVQFGRNSKNEILDYMLTL